MEKYTREELLKMDAVEVYKMVLKGDLLKIFPSGFWQLQGAKENAAKCTRYLMEEKLNYTEEQIREKNSISLFFNNKLSGMINICFNGSPYEAINNAYPNKFKEWEFKNVPKGYWNNKENGIKATKWLIETKLKLSDKQLKKELSTKLFKDNGFGGMLDTCFYDSPYKAINEAYPGKFKEWEFKSVPVGYWENQENGIKATRWLIEEKLKLSDEQLKKQLSTKLFRENGLGGMLDSCFHDSPYKAVNSAYPNKYKEWEFKNTPMRYWENEENAIKSTKWLIEEKLKLSEDELKIQLSQKLFENNGLGGMLGICFNNSPYEAISKVYPNKYKEWEFKQVPRGYWEDKENGIKAIKWLIEEKLKLSDEDVKKQISTKFFKENGLGGMLDICFEYSPYKAINEAYPNKYKEWEFKNVPNGYWKDKNNRVKATKWLIEKKLKLSDKELKKQLSDELFKKHGMNGMLNFYFNYSSYRAINEAYPNKFKRKDFELYNR